MWRTYLKLVLIFFFLSRAQKVLVAPSVYWLFSNSKSNTYTDPVSILLEFTPPKPTRLKKNQMILRTTGSMNIFYSQITDQILIVLVKFQY